MAAIRRRRAGGAVARRACAALALGVAAPAAGQTLPDTIFQAEGRDLRRDGDDRFVLDTSDRLEPKGVRAGPFLIVPQLETLLLADTNVFASGSDGQADVAAVAAPSVRISGLSPSYDLDAYVNARAQRHARFDTENVEALAAGLALSKTFGDNLTLSSRFEAATFTEDRAAQLAPLDNLTPVEVTRFTGRLGASATFGRLVLNGAFFTERTTFDDNLRRSDPTRVLVQRDRNLVQINPTAEIGYRLSPATLFYVGGSYNRRDYDFVPPPGALLPSRDSEGYAVFGGVRFQPSALTRVDVAAGYQAQNYQAPFTDPSGLYFRATVDWTPRRTLLLRGEVLREISETGALLLGGATRTRVRVAADYLPTRRVRIGARADFIDIASALLPDSDRRVLGSLTGSYDLNRYVSFVSDAAVLVSRPGLAIISDFERFRFTAGVRFRL